MLIQYVSGSVCTRVILALWQTLLRLGEGSSVVHAARSAVTRWKHWWHASAVVWFLIEKEGLLPRAWPGSRCCWLLSQLINLPAAILHRAYRKGKAVFETSFFAQLAFGLGEQVPLAAGWLMLLFMNIPYEKWNNAYSLAGFALLVLLTITGGMRRRSLRLDVVSVGPYLVCFLAAVCLAWPLSCEPSESFRFLYYHAACALCILVTVSTVEREEQLERLAGFGCLGMLGTSVYAMVQRIQGVAVTASTVDLEINAGMPGRVYSFYDNSNAFAAVLVLLIPVSIGLLFGAKGKRYRLIGFVSAVMGMIALVMTYSRACWLGLIAAAIVFVFLWNRKFLPVLILVGIIAIPFLPSTILNRFLTIFNSNDSSISSRGPIYQAALRLIRLRPVTGAGLGTAAVQTAIRESEVYEGTFAFVHSHNTLLQVWLETGLVGVVAFAAGMFHAVKTGAKAVFRSKGTGTVRMLIVGSVSGVVGAMVCGLADYLWSYPRVMLIFWFTVALLIAAVKLAGSRTGAETEIERE